MKGKTNEEILKVREQAIAAAQALLERDQEIEVIDSFFNGWQEARGCRIEHICAVEYGIEVMEE